MTEAEQEQKFTGLANALNALAQQLQETRTVIEKLAKVSGLEYSQDVKEWVAKEKLDALRKEPR